MLDDSQAETDRFRHRAFGIEQSHSGATDTSFTFGGQQSYYSDPELDLYFLSARYYDPAAARFVSQDPIGFEAGDENLYQYVGNNPVISAAASPPDRFLVTLRIAKAPCSALSGSTTHAIRLVYVLLWPQSWTPKEMGRAKNSGRTPCPRRRPGPAPWVECSFHRADAGRAASTRRSNKQRRRIR